MKLSDERIDKIVTAFSDSQTLITPDLAHDLAQISQNYTAIKIIELYNERTKHLSDKLSPKNIAKVIWDTAKIYNLRAGNAFPVMPIAHKIDASHGYSREELASGLSYLADQKGWIKDGETITVTEEGFKYL